MQRKFRIFAFSPYYRRPSRVSGERKMFPPSSESLPHLFTIKLPPTPPYTNSLTIPSLFNLQYQRHIHPHHHHMSPSSPHTQSDATFPSPHFPPPLPPHNSFPITSEQLIPSPLNSPLTSPPNTTLFSGLICGLLTPVVYLPADTEALDQLCYNNTSSHCTIDPLRC